MSSKDIKNKIKEIFINEYNSLFKDGHLKDIDIIKRSFRQIIDGLIVDKRIQISDEEKDVLIDDLSNDILGFGPINMLLNDPQVTEIMINGSSKVFIERNGKMQLTDIKFEDEEHLMRVIYNMLSPTRRRVDESNPFADLMIPGNCRVNIVLHPISLQGPVVTIRKFSQEINKIEDLIKFGTLNNKMADFLIASIKAKLNIIFAGATGAGKTTTLNVLSNYIPYYERIITIEDTAELFLSQEHVVRMEAKQANIEGRGEITMGDIFKNSLRMRPNRIILGEVRGDEALSLLQALSSGHSGSLAVLHASSPHDAIRRLETMVLSTGLSIPLWVVRSQIASCVDLIIQHEQLADGSRKITKITEVTDYQNEDVSLADLFYFIHEGVDSEGKIYGVFKSAGIKPTCSDKFRKMNVDISSSLFEKD